MSRNSKAGPAPAGGWLEGDQRQGKLVARNVAASLGHGTSQEYKCDTAYPWRSALKCWRYIPATRNARSRDWLRLRRGSHAVSYR